MPEIDKLNNCRRWRSYGKGEEIQKAMRNASGDGDFLFTHKFDRLFCPSISAFLSNFAWKKDSDLPICELVRFEGKLPLYLDIEWVWSNAENIQPLISFAWLFQKYIGLKPLNSYDFLLENFAITKGTRLKEDKSLLKYKHSYHLIWRGNFNKNCYYFNNQREIRWFLQDLESFSVNSLDIDDIKHRQQIIVNDGKSIIDMSVYNKKPGTCQSMRIPYSVKDNVKDSALVPINLEWDIKQHFVNYISPSAVEYKVTEPSKITKEILNEKKKKECPLLDTEFCQEIPLRISNRAKSLYHNTISKNGSLDDFIDQEVAVNGAYLFRFRNVRTHCGICMEIHKSRSSSHYTHTVIYNPTTTSYSYCCASQIRDNPKNKKYLAISSSLGNTHWDLVLPKTRCPNFPAIQDDFIETGGTYFCESPKGTGKSEAVCKLLNKLDPADKVCMISFRVNLCDKIYSETKEYGITHYRKRDFDVNKCVVCLNSLFKCKAEGLVYDYIIIDEIYSVMESFSSTLLDKHLPAVLAFFNKLISQAKKVYLLDAHLRCDMINEPFSKLRDPSKFIFHKNPNGHNYDDYQVFYDEYKDKKKDKNYEDYLKLLLDFVAKGKKIAVCCLSKVTSDEIAEIVLDANPSWELSNQVKLYNKDTDDQEKKVDFGDTQKAWSQPNVKVIIYSPTVSAGISYNDASITGVDILMVFGAGGQGYPSFNTFKQMTHRCRQLNDKKIYIMMNTSVKGKVLTKYQITKQINNNLEDVNLLVRNQAFYKLDGLDEDCKPVYDISTWEYSLITNIMSETLHYYSLENIKEGLIKEFCNRPEDEEAGRGMKFTDLTITQNQEIVQGNFNPLETIEDAKVFQEGEALRNWYNVPHINFVKFEEINMSMIMGDTITIQEKFQYKRWLKMNNYRIGIAKLNRASYDPEDILPITDEAIGFLDKSTFYEDAVYRNQSKWKDSYDREEIHNSSMNFVAQKILWKGGDQPLDDDDLKNIKANIEKEFRKSPNPILIKKLAEKGLDAFARVENMFDLIGLESLKFTDLAGLKLNKTSFKKIDLVENDLFVRKVIFDIYGDNQMMLNKYNDNCNFIRKFYEENPNKNFFDTEYSDLATNPNFNTDLLEWREPKYKMKQKYTDKNLADFKEKIMNGTRSNQDTKKFRPELYEFKDWIKLVSHCISKIGYKIESVKPNGRGKTAVTNWIIVDMFVKIKSLQRYKNIKLPKGTKEVIKELKMKPSHHLDMNVED